MKFVKLGTVILLLVGLASPLAASVHTLDFDDGSTQFFPTPLGGLQDYFENALGRTNVSTGDAIWVGSSLTFGSDGIFSRGYSSKLDFDTGNRASSDYEIEALSFRWGVFDNTFGRDFGLDVYDDGAGVWHNNHFTVGGVGNLSSGYSGLITFASAWEITKIRFHDSGTVDVGLDDLVVYDNAVSLTAAVPEPSSMMVWSLLAMGCCLGARRKK